MEDIQQQLALLRRRIARIDRKWRRQSARPAARRRARTSAARYFDRRAHVSGEVVEHRIRRALRNREALGAPPPARQHGYLRPGRAARRPARLALRRRHPARAPAKVGLSRYRNHGSGGRHRHVRVPGRAWAASRREGFRLRQFFMRDYGEEASLLARLSEYLARFDVLITYNGKTYDQPLLETRFRMARARHPFDRLEHLDLLFGARRLWKLRLESCRLVDLENQILGVERQGDLPGEMIPYCLLRVPAHAAGLPPGAHLPPQRHRHSFAGVPDGHRSLRLPRARAGAAPARRGPHRPGALAAARPSGARRRCGCSAAPSELGLPDDLLFRTLWDIGAAREERSAATTPRWPCSPTWPRRRNPYRAARARRAGQALRAPRAQLRHGARNDPRRPGPRGHARHAPPQGTDRAPPRLPPTANWRSPTLTLCSAPRHKTTRTCAPRYALGVFWYRNRKRVLKIG